MKKQWWVMVGIAGLLVGSCLPLHAGMFGTASLLRPGGFSVGLEPAFGFSPSQFLFNLHGDLGLTRTINLETTLGFGSYTYLGAGLQFGLMPDTSRTVGIAFVGGVHGTSHLGLDTSLLISKRFRTFSLYGGLDADFEFVSTPENVVIPFYIDLGFAIPTARNMDVFLEGNIGVNAAANSGLSGGIKFYF